MPAGCVIREFEELRGGQESSAATIVLFAHVLIVAAVFPTRSAAVKRCTANDKCWPSAEIWSAFNSSVGGRLVAPRPPAWPCHDPNYDEAACNDAKANWNISSWRADQTGATQDPVWEGLGCSIATPRNAICKQGFVPVYAIAAQDSSDVSEAVKFAGKHNLKLVVKNTGHDYLGRASGEGSFSIWTHRLKGISLNNSFVGAGCSTNTSGVPAITVGAGEYWADVYKKADELNVTVAGGGSRGVGAAGGWLQGGGHGPLGGLHGMGVDNVLQFTMVTADGNIVYANACQNKDLFWALRGGGSGTWGQVALDVTYKAHPPLYGMVALGFQLNATTPKQMIQLSTVLLEAVPKIADAGIRGYCWAQPNSTLCFFLHPNSQSVQLSNTTLWSIYDWVADNPGAQLTSFGGTLHPTFYDMFIKYFQDSGIANPSWLGSRLVSRGALVTNSKKLAKIMSGENPIQATSLIHIIGGGAVNKVNPDSTGLNPQWRRDALVHWVFSGHLSYGAPKQNERIKKEITKLTKGLGAIAGLDNAAYFNEADPGEPQWKKAFFGSHYDRLLRVKRKVDPKHLFTCNRCVGFESGV
ncbi:hypothetical protein CTheo_5910 [Ceratobasidium theobromae]|uniref:FAD-binding PCMH-type domain-containing protein n=1 Tax=Ceratobasidium theobromae TaxID=1582974 RepID=A0A5N5QH94_9AGAM|nr:hypothetical protein CTheo_5910 [Ceratobasidium theobromae]